MRMGNLMATINVIVGFAWYCVEKRAEGGF
jgi:hypothetical protein